MWNIALDGSGNPHIPSQTPCGSAGCRPIATVNSDGTYSLNQECEPNANFYVASMVLTTIR
jgi:hypothetical protein